MGKYFRFFRRICRNSTSSPSSPGCSVLSSFSSPASSLFSSSGASTGICTESSPSSSASAKAATAAVQIMTSTSSRLIHFFITCNTSLIWFSVSVFRCPVLGRALAGPGRQHTFPAAHKAEIRVILVAVAFHRQRHGECNSFLRFLQHGGNQYRFHCHLCT